MSNIVPFDGNNLPAHLRAAAGAASINAGAANGTSAGVSINKLSIKGGKFRLVENGEEVKVFDKLALDLVIVRANDFVTKTYYAKQWKPGQEPEAPDCSSDDGIKPRADSKNKQCDNCAACKHNEWGSYINPQTGAKGKSCSDSKRIAVCPPGRLKEGKLYQLQIPAASLREFGSFIGKLNSVEPAVPYNAVLTRFSFDTEVTFPKLKFEPTGWLNEQQYAEAQERYDSKEAKETAGVPGAQAPAAGLKPEAPKQEPAPQAQQQAQADDEFDDGFGEEPAAQAQPQQQAAQDDDDGFGGSESAPQKQAQSPAPQQRRPRKPRQEAAPKEEPATIDGSTGQVDNAAGSSELDDVFGEGWDD